MVSKPRFFRKVMTRLIRLGLVPGLICNDIGCRLCEVHVYNHERAILGRAYSCYTMGAKRSYQREFPMDPRPNLHMCPAKT